MKTLIVLLFVFALSTFAQDKPVRENVPQNMKECVDKVHGNMDAVKMLMKRIMMDKEHREALHKAMMNDPEMREVMKEMQKEMHEMDDVHMMDHKMDKDKMKHEDNMKMHQNDQDTTMHKKK